MGAKNISVYYGKDILEYINLKIEKKTITYNNDPQEFYSYEAWVGPQKFNVWFKFGCAHLTTIPPEGSGEEPDYIHICEPEKLVSFLIETLKMSTKEGNSWEQ